MAESADRVAIAFDPAQIRKAQDRNPFVKISDIVYDILSEAILSSTIAPGSKLNISSIAENLNISHTPVFQAVDRLKNSGLIVESNETSKYHSYRVLDIVIIDNGAAIIKNRFAQDTPGFPQALIFQRDPLCFDDVLDRDHSGNAIIEIRIIGGDDFTGDPLQSLFPVIWCSHALVSLSSPDDLMRRLIRSIKSCHSWSVASASLAVRSAARTISRSMM